jgi:hypothetical protein
VWSDLLPLDISKSIHTYRSVYLFCISCWAWLVLVECPKQSFFCLCLVLAYACFLFFCWAWERENKFAFLEENESRLHSSIMRLYKTKMIRACKNSGGKKTLGH